MKTPNGLAAREAEIVAQVRKDLEARGKLLPVFEPLIAQYASALVEAERLTEEARKYDAASQEARRVLAARDRSQRTAGALASKIGLTARTRGSDRSKSGKGGSLLGLIREHEAKPETQAQRAECWAAYEERAEHRRRERAKAVAEGRFVSPIIADCPAREEDDDDD